RMVTESARINAYQFGLYQLLRHNRLYFSNIDSFSNSDYSTTRQINLPGIARTAKANSSGDLYGHYSELGATLGSGQTRFQPFKGIQYIYLDQHGFSEDGAGSLNLTTSHQFTNSIRGSVGARLYQERRWRNLTYIPTLTGRYQHEFGNGTNLITSSLA